jgi:hypothetical protein
MLVAAAGGLWIATGWLMGSRAVHLAGFRVSPAFSFIAIRWQVFS